MAEIIGDLDELTGIVHRSARQQVLDLEADTRRRAKLVRDQADAQARGLREEVLAAVERETAEERRRVMARVALEVHRKRLAAREALLDQVWTEAESRLRTLPGQPTYGEVLRRLALAAATVLGQGTIVLAADATGHSLLTPEVLAEWSAAAHAEFLAAEQPAPIWGGLIARDRGTRREVDASFATRLALALTENRVEAARILGIV